jgi:hypothetical protein
MEPLRSSQRLERRWIRLAAALAAVLAPAARAQVEALPPGHWAYAELVHFENRGLLVLPGIRPYSRADVRLWVESLGGALAAGKLSRVEAGRLRRLQDEFVHGASLAAASRRFDPPLLHFGESPWDLAFDAEVATGGAGSFGAAGGPEQDGTAWGRTRLEAVLRHSDWAAYETRYDVLLAEEEGARAGENFVSSRERNWRGLTSQAERAYLAFAGRKARLVLGREYSAWGSAPGDELLVSDAGHSLDAVQARVQVRRLTLASTAAWLSVDAQRNLAAHRLELDLGRVRLGFHEAAVYVSPHLEPTYLFPLSFYYGNQFNERSDDNVLLGFDAKWSSPAGVFDAELLVDDFIYDGDPAPNRLGLRLGWRRGAAVAGADVDLRLGYVALGRWVYLHRDSLDNYVAASGDPGLDPFLGHPLGPDADRLQLEARCTPDPRWSLELLLARTRRGDGNRDLSDWVPGEDYDVAFPSGDVWTEHSAGLGTHWFVTRRLSLSVSAAYAAGTQGRSGRVAAEIRLDP